MTDSSQTIFRSARRFFSGTMLSRITGLLRDIAMAFAFGTHSAIAAFMIAFRFSHLLRRVFGEGAMQSALIPHFEQLRRDDPARAYAFFRDLKATLVVSLGMGIALLIALLGWWGGHNEVLTLTRLMLPSLLFICLFGVNLSVMQCEGSYLLSGMAPVVFNCIWILAALLLRNYPIETAMPSLAIAIIIGCAGQWLVTEPRVRALRRQKSGGGNFPLRIFSTDVRRLGKPLLLGMMGIMASQVNSALDPLFARLAHVEGPAYLWYAIRLQQAPLALFGVAMSAALLPPLSRAIKNGEFAQAEEFLHQAIRRLLKIMIPTTIALFGLGPLLIRVLYFHGNFDMVATTGTTWCLWGYTIGLVPMALVLVISPAFYARNDYKRPAIASFLAVGANVLLNATLIMGFNRGPASVAVATSISAWLQVAILGYWMRKSN